MPGPVLTFNNCKNVIIDNVHVECSHVSSGIRFRECNDVKIRNGFYLHGFGAGGYGVGTSNFSGELTAVGAHVEQWAWGEAGFDDQANRVGYGWLMRTADFTLTGCLSNYTGVPYYKDGYGSWSMSQCHGYNGALTSVTDADNILSIEVADPSNGVIDAFYSDQGAVHIKCDDLHSATGKTLQS